MSTRSFVQSALASTLLLAVVSQPAAAHVGHGEAHGVIHGFFHPFVGLDHILAMVSVGILAALLAKRFERRFIWALPVAFMTMMSVGAALAMAGFNLPFAELGISLSVVALGLAIALQISLPMISGMVAVGVFALFHGFAHGAEIPVDTSGAAYGAGFLLATALLHLAGVGVGLALGGRAPAAGVIARLTGAAIAIAGIGLVTAS